MATVSPSHAEIENIPQARSVQIGRLARKIGVVLLRILAGISIALTLIPVALLPFITSVPLPLSILLILADVALIVVLLRLARSWLAKTTMLAGFVAVAVLAVALSQVFAATPTIVDANGAPLPNGIATLETVDVNGSEQWITIRGNDVNNPVLLFLSGGPGGSELPSTRLHLSALEEHFVVVNWDQPGAAKSYGAVDISTLTPERYVADGHALVQYLRARFDEDKIYVVGESWGTILGTWLIRDYPDLFYAYVGSGQMVNTTENDVLGYEFALEYLAKRGDTNGIERLRRNGPPPYAEGNPMFTYAAYLGVLNDYMAGQESGQDVDILIDAIREPEYGLLDKVNWLRGLMDVFNVVYPQLTDLDLSTQAAKLEVPVYVILGRHDVNAMTSLAEDYFSVLDAPHKELIWFEKSGHPPLYSEADKLVDLLVNRVLPQTYPRTQPAAQLTNDLDDAGEVEAFFDGLISRQLEEHHIAGAAVAVVKDGQLRLAKGYGYADLEAQEPVVADRTLFRTDSVGKLFVWTAVMQLVENGALDLDADVNTYLDFGIPATYPQPITLRHLLSHSAGFEDQGYMFAHTEADVAPAGTFLAHNIPARVRPPGELSGYSNYGAALAGYIVERVSGMSFEQYVEEHIFAPLEMQHSTFRQPLPPALEAGLTQNYQWTGDGYNLVPFQFLKVPPAGEGHTTVTDMAKFMLAHLSPGDTPILTQATLAQMHSRLFSHAPQVNGFAYGFAEMTTNNQRILRHEGNNPGVSSTALFLIPDQQAGVYVAYNSNGGFVPGEESRRAVLNHYYPASATPPAPVRLSDDQVRQLSGSYRSTRMFHTTFGKIARLLGGNYADVVVSANDDGTFTTQGVGTSPLTWMPVEPRVLRLADGALDSVGDLRFGADEQGQITTLFVENNPYRAYEKVAWYEAVSLHTLLLGACLVIFLSVVVAAPLGWLIRRAWPAAGIASVNPLAWGLLMAACAASLLVPVGLLLTLEESLVYGITAGLVAVLTLPLVALTLTVASVVVAARTWSDSHWSVVGLIHYSVGANAMIVFIGWLNYWNLLGFRF